MKRTLETIAVFVMLLALLTACGENMSGSRTERSVQSNTEDGTSAGRPSNEVDELEPEYGVGADGDTVRYGGSRGSATANTTPNTTLHGSYDAPTGTPAGDTTGRAAASVLKRNGKRDLTAEDTRYQQMLDNAHVRDTDGFLLDGENPKHDTLW